MHGPSKSHKGTGYFHLTFKHASFSVQNNFPCGIGLLTITEAFSFQKSNIIVASLSSLCLSISNICICNYNYCLRSCEPVDQTDQ